MTLKEAIERYTNNADYESIYGSMRECLDFRQLAKWLKDYKRLLEQETKNNPQPSEHFIDGVHAIGYREGYKDAQKQKSGKWIITHLSNMAYCSECDYLFKDIPASVVEQFKYCPNCGCRMVATQEREG